MRILFDSDPMNPRIPDAAYANEVAAAERLGITNSLVSFEALVDEGRCGASRASCCTRV